MDAGKIFTAIVLAGGRGRRMNASVPKQYLLLQEKPILYYSVKAFEESPVDSIIIVTGENETEYCKREIVDKYGLSKVKSVVTGGKERYHSVYQGLLAAEGSDYVLIHDGARPFVTEKMITDSMEQVKKYQACVCAMPVKDTIKIADGEGFAVETPDRSRLYMVQTPQTFSMPLISGAYDRLMKQEIPGITDDAMVVERMTETKVRLIDGDYDNLKITTPEDLPMAEAVLKSRKEKKENS